MVNFQAQDGESTTTRMGIAMNEIFHTEDCGLSLICRCCRGPVCAQRLSKADRLRVQKDWAAYPTRQGDKANESARGVFGRFAMNLVDRIAAWRLPGRKTHQSVEQISSSGHT